MDKPRLSFWQIWNMSFGFLGIQFGWGLQMANMSAIYEYLGARPDQIPILWLAAPLTRLDRPADHRAHERPHLEPAGPAPPLLPDRGALLASAALVLMPQSPALWMAAGLLWIMDASINVSMEPFRAFVADLLPEEQRTRGFAMQSLFIGLGAVVASALPLDDDESVPRSERPSNGPRHSPHGATFFLCGSHCFPRRSDLDDREHEGVSAGRSRGFCENEAGEVRLL